MYPSCVLAVVALYSDTHYSRTNTSIVQALVVYKHHFAIPTVYTHVKDFAKIFRDNRGVHSSTVEENWMLK